MEQPAGPKAPPAVEVHEDVSPAMADRIIARMRASIDRKAAARKAGEWSDTDEAWDVLHSFVVASLASATTDARAEVIIRLGDDLLARRDESAIVQVLSGRIDLVALLSARAEAR
jgi:hypothetical protein